MSLLPIFSRMAGAALLVSGATSTALAQWNVIQLHPPGATGSLCYGIRGAGQQVGVVDGNATIWSGSPGSTVSLGPGFANSTDSVQQVGGRNGRAALWTGTAGSYVDLHPSDPNAYISIATGVHAGIQAGYFHETNFSITHAGIWTDTAASWIDLTPPGSPASAAFGVHNAQQVGTAYLGGGPLHAVVWYNSAASVVDLHPAGASVSQGFGVFSGRQTGVVTLIGESFRRASMWSSNAASYVDLHPPASSESVGQAIYGTAVAGWATVGGVNHASYWNGAASTWNDLHAYLPANYSESAAYGIWVSNAGVAHVVGNAFNTTTGNYEGILWVQSVPAVTLYCYGDGSGAPCPCVNYAPLYSSTGCLNSLGIGGKLVSTGNASIANDTFTLLGSQMPNGSALYFQGTVQLLGQVFGDGIRCVAGSVIRLGPKMNVNGSSSYPSGSPPVSVQGQVTSPGMRAYQIWYRNADPVYCTPATFNFTNGLAVTWGS